ncbi:hypothetical protein BH11BAC2_BH11BAC2_07200 [soil metagenome]
MMSNFDRQNFDDVLQAQVILQTFRKRDSYMVEYPSDLQLLLYGEKEWLQQLSVLFDSGNYVTSPIELIDVPKGKGMIRHYVHMNFADQLYYTWLVIKCFPAILCKINPTITDPASILKSYGSDSDWMKRTFRNNLDLIGMQRAALKSQHGYMFSTDITNFSPSIDHQLLYSELIAAGVEARYAEMLKIALSSWSNLFGRGLPQIFWASDIISEFYLYPMDEYLRQKGYAFTRIFDNVEIFAKDESTCRLLFADLIKSNSKRGLYFNESKTVFESTEGLRTFLSGKKTLAQNIKSKFKSFPTGIAKTYYMAESWIGDSDVTQRLNSRPEDTLPYIKHYSDFQIDIGDNLATYIINENNRYPYQIYSILRWLSDHPDEITPGLFKSFTKIIKEEKKPIYIICLAADLLLKFGTIEDFNFIRKQVENSTQDSIRTELAAMIRIFFAMHDKIDLS